MLDGGDHGTEPEDIEAVRNQQQRPGEHRIWSGKAGGEEGRSEQPGDGGKADIGAAIARPELVDEIADRFGSQVLVLSLDVKRSERMPSGFVVTTHGGRKETDLDALAWCREAVERGAGELLVNSMDADGTLAGFDLELTRKVRELAMVPVIASGGAGKLEHFAPAVAAGADAVLAASVFHDGTFTVGEVKRALAEAGYEVRLAEVAS